MLCYNVDFIKNPILRAFFSNGILLEFDLHNNMINETINLKDHFLSAFKIQNAYFCDTNNLNIYNINESFIKNVEYQKKLILCCKKYNNTFLYLLDPTMPHLELKPIFTMAKSVEINNSIACNCLSARF